MTKTWTLDGSSYTSSNCITCGVVYFVPSSVWNEQQNNGGFHYCPSGHKQGWDKSDSEAARVRRERDRLKQRLAEEKDSHREAMGRAQKNLDNANRRAAAHKGNVTKLKKRASAGVCPCCSRTFQNLARHMHSKHPDFADDKSNVVPIKDATA